MFSEKDLVFLGACLIKAANIASRTDISDNGEGAVNISQKIYDKVFKSE